MYLSEGLFINGLPLNKSSVEFVSFDWRAQDCVMESRRPVFTSLVLPCLLEKYIISVTLQIKYAKSQLLQLLENVQKTHTLCAQSCLS